MGLGWGGPVSFCVRAVAVFTLTFAENAVVSSSLGMSDWQINAVHLIDLINGHSRGQKFVNPGVILCKCRKYLAQ